MQYDYGSDSVSMKTIKIKAPAKINLTLDILRKRDDGYHEVNMVMQTIGLYDTICASVTDDGIGLSMDSDIVPSNENNLAYKAAKIFLDEHNIKDGIDIKIEKNIPVAAGLAGGSADAAGVIRAMDYLFDTKMTDEDFCAMGAEIGSDVPFSILGGTMLAKGRGEALTRLTNAPPAWCVIAKPPISVSTAWAYRAYDDAGNTSHPDTDAMIEAIEEMNIKKIASNLFNVLEIVTAQKHHIIKEYEKILLDNGAINSIMSGSGPTVFAIMNDKSDAESAAEALRSSDKARGAEIFVVPFIKNEDLNEGM